VAKASAAVSPCARTKAGVNQRVYKEYTITNFDNIMDVNDRRKSEGTRPVLQVYNLVASDSSVCNSLRQSACCQLLNLAVYTIHILY